MGFRMLCQSDSPGSSIGISPLVPKPVQKVVSPNLFHKHFPSEVASDFTKLNMLML